MITTPNLYIGLGSAVYALVKSDGHLHNIASLKARMILMDEPHGELAMQSFIMREHYNIPADEAYSFAMRCFVEEKKALKNSLKKYFITLIQKVAEADQQVSDQEAAFIQHFRRDIHQI